MQTKHLIAAIAAATIAVLIVTGAAVANPSPVAPATVILSRTDRILIPPGWAAPEMFYPQGRIDYVPVAEVLTAAVRRYTRCTAERANPWADIATPQDKVGIQVDLTAPPVSRETINAIIDGLVNSGVAEENIIVYAGEEKELFDAGIALNRTGRGVRTMGSESEGFRNGLSRIVLDYCTVIINVARLRADRDLGMRGCVVTSLNSVPLVERMKALKAPATLASAAANPVLRMKTRLHILEAYQPIIHDTGEKYPPVWEYRGALMSNDPVAVDVVGMQILQGKLALGEHTLSEGHAKPNAALAYLEPASGDELRVGQSDPEKITVEALGTMRDIIIDATQVD